MVHGSWLKDGWGPSPTHPPPPTHSCSWLKTHGDLLKAHASWLLMAKKDARGLDQDPRDHDLD